MDLLKTTLVRDYMPNWVVLKIIDLEHFLKRSYVWIVHKYYYRMNPKYIPIPGCRWINEFEISEIAVYTGFLELFSMWIEKEENVAEVARQLDQLSQRKNRLAGIFKEYRDLYNEAQMKCDRVGELIFAKSLTRIRVSIEDLRKEIGNEIEKLKNHTS